MKRYVAALVPLAVFLVMAGLFAVSVFRGQPWVLSSAMVGKPVPEFILPSAFPGGRHLADEDLKGHVSVVNVFASWCVPCQAEQPVLEKLGRDTGVPLYGINYKDQSADVDAWLEKHGNPFQAVGFDARGRVSIDWGVYGVPETFVVDKKGIIRLRHVGPVTPQDAETLFKPLFKRLEAEP